MESHEVMRQVLEKTSAKRIAADLGVSLSLVYKWSEPPLPGAAGGAGSPLQRVGQLVRATGDAGIAQWVCEQADGFYIRNPRTAAAGGVVPATNDIVREFADMLATIAQASADNRITRAEAGDIRRRWEELKSVTEGFVRAAEAGNFGSPEGGAGRRGVT
jgi:hypothetical protein